MFKILIAAFCFLNFTAIAQSQANDKPGTKNVASYTVSGMNDDAEDPANTIPVPPDDSTTVYYYADPMPVFPGNLEKYIKQQLASSKTAPKDKVNGNVRVQFLIMRNGTVANPKIKKSLREDCDKEALKLIQDMPAWKPGLKDGKPVIVSYSLDVPFK